MTVQKPKATCPSRDKLRALTMGIVSEDQSDVLLRHLDDCGECQSELDTLDNAEDSLIVGLRNHAPGSDIDSEPQCHLAIAKALGALAEAHQNDSGSLPNFPRSIGEYEIVRPLGKGGMGRVFLARQTKLGREVALKVIADHRLADPNVRRRFENEMQAVGRLSHPNIVIAHDAREIDSTAVLVTEYIDGLDLGQIVERLGTLSIADACKAAEQVAVALQYTADQGFVHRDIKPSNVMLSRTGEVKLLDLGLARLQKQDPSNLNMTGTGQTMGTADYVSPEQVNDSREVDIRSDLYSLGCTLFKLLTGKPLFSSDDHATAFAKLNAHVSEVPPRVSDLREGIPKGLVKLIDRLLSKNPDQRPAEPMQVAKKLSQYSVDAKLNELIDQALDAPRGDLATVTSGADTTPVPQPLLLPWWRKPVPMLIAIASGFLGGGLGILLGILITIEMTDGTKIITKAPDGSIVSVQNDPGSDVPSSAGLSKHSEGQTNSILPPDGVALGNPIPLMFAVLVDDPQLVPTSPQNVGKIRTSGIEQVSLIKDRNGIWFPVHENCESIVTQEVGLDRYALVSAVAADQLKWSELQNHINLVQSMGGRFELGFDEAAANKMATLTKKNLNKKLAVILDGTVIAAPMVVTELYDRVMVHGNLGNFSHQQLQLLGSLASRRMPADTNKGKATTAKSRGNPTMGTTDLLEPTTTLTPQDSRTSETRAKRSESTKNPGTTDPRRERRAPIDF